MFTAQASRRVRIWNNLRKRLNIALNQASFRPVADLRGRVRVMGAECQLFRRLPGPAASSVKREIQWSISRSAFGEAEMPTRSEEHTSELQSLMRISYAVFCLKKKNNTKYIKYQTHKQNTNKS